MDYQGNNKVFKFGNSTYIIGELNFNYLNNKFCKNFVYNILSLLDRGNKFVPCYYSNNFYFFSNIINIYKNFLEKLNKKIFFSNKDPETNNDFLYLTRDYIFNLKENVNTLTNNSTKSCM